MPQRVQWADKEGFLDEKDRRVYFAITLDLAPEPRKIFTESACALVLWIFMWINVFVAIAYFIGWTASNPRMGFYAFNGPAILLFVWL
jgi:hypothetical protein